MAKLRKHGSTWYARYKDPATGKRVEKSLGTSDEALAKRLCREIERREKRATRARSIGESFRTYADEWIEARRRVGVRNVDQDERWLRLHVYDVIGDAPLHIITPRDLRDWAMDLRASGKLAPKSIWNAYGVIQSVFRSAAVDGLITQSPCILTESELGPARDRDPAWRPQAIYTRQELHTLCYDERLEAVDRVTHALAGLAGLRQGEACGLRFADITRAEPLSRMLVTRSHDGPTKTNTARRVPVHPALASILAEWKLSGWPELVGRHPTDDDFVIATGRTRRGRPGRPRTKSMAYKAWTRALAAVELASDAPRGEKGGRAYHDLRRTFVSLAQADGADKAILEHITHQANSSRAIDLYTTIPWERLCEPVMALRFGRELPRDGVNQWGR